MSVEEDEIISLQEEDEVLQVEEDGAILEEGEESPDQDEDQEDLGDLEEEEEYGNLDEGGPGTFGAYSEEHINDQVFEELKLPSNLVDEVQNAWQSFLGASERPEAAGDAIYSALFDAAPSLQSLFKTPRAVMAMKFMQGIHAIVQACGDPAGLKVAVEALGFRHLDLEVTIPRVILFRDAIIDVMSVELGEALQIGAACGLRVLLNYVGGAFIYIRTKFSERLKVIQASWTAATRKGLEEKTEVAPAANGSSEYASEALEGNAKKKDASVGKKSSWLARGKKAKRAHGSASASDSPGEVSNAVVPKTFHDMFLFNAAVMGFGNKTWMLDVLEAFDAIVSNVANTQRLQEECEVLALSMSKHISQGHVVLNEYKAVMLASLRSLVRDWGSSHEVAWSWLWENVERMLKAVMHKPAAQQRALAGWLATLDGESKQFIRVEMYIRFFAMAPTGQDYFKQSTTRLHFIVDKLAAMTMEMYVTPKDVVNDLSAMGLRHVGYGVPVEMFSPFVTSVVQTVREVTENEQQLEAFSWSLNLISRILCRVITEGSTIVMKAINENSAAMLRKAVGCAPRGERSAWVLSVQVGAQSISPLLWAIRSGSLEASKAILVDLLTIRADRDSYYFGADYLFERHPDILRRLSLDAPGLLPTFLDGFVWRSRNTENGLRRVNYWIKHFLVDAEGNFAQNIEWLVAHGDPKLICHPVAAVAVDLVWNNVAFRTFLLGKTWFLFTTIIFIISQSILTHATSTGGDRLTLDGRILMVVCRAFIYVFSMGEMIFKQGRLCLRDVRQRNFVRVLGVPVPEYLGKWQNACSFALMCCLILMFSVEPILDCMSKGPEENFTRAWCRGDPWRFTYALLSTVSILLYFVLMTDFTVFSTQISAFTLICTRLVRELWLFLFATTVLSIAFACAISALRQDDEHFDNPYNSLLHLWKIPVNMLDASAFDDMEDEHAPLFIALWIYITLVCTFFMSVFIAQLNSAYQATFEDMIGFARLNRGAIVVATMSSVPDTRWNKYIESLELQQRIEFGEGDIGLAGGIQMFEPASLHPTTQESVKRFAGTTAKDAPWPSEEASAEDDVIGRLNKLEKMMEKSMKKIQHIVKGGSGSMMSSSRMTGSVVGSALGSSGSGSVGSDR